jgi:hypothetical protein
MVPVKQTIRAGQIAREDVEFRLGKHAEILDQKISAALWYPVEATGVFHEIMAEQMPGPRQAALVDQGILAVRHLSQQDVYGQLDFKGRSLDETRSRDVISFGRRVSTIMHSFYNFGEAVFEGDPDKERNYYLRWTDVAPLPDAIRFVTEGFIKEIIANLNLTPMRVTSKRLTPDRIEFALRPLSG